MNRGGDITTHFTYTQRCMQITARHSWKDEELAPLYEAVSGAESNVAKDGSPK